MTTIPLQLGALNADGYTIFRSGVRWLCEPGQLCRPNQVIAYFNLSFKPSTPRTTGAPFDDERVLQVGCAPAVGGRVSFDPTAGPGGYLSIFGLNRWDSDAVLAHLESDDLPAAADADPGRLRLLLLAGRRMTPLVDVHAGLLPGWQSRSRAWWGEGDVPVTLLALGICDVSGVIMGEQGAFLEMFAAEHAASQVVCIPDHPIAPSAPVLLDQLERTANQAQAIVADVREALARSVPVPTGDDYMFAGTMISMLQRCPIRDRYDIVSPSGLTRTGPADAVLLSLSAEAPSILQHKTLGYRLQILSHHQVAAGPAMRKWLTTSFEPVARTTETIKADYEKLLDAIQHATGARAIVVNRMSTSGDEDISTYAPFDVPMSGTLANIASKELNLMLHDVAAGRNVAIVDVDAIAADIGGAEHLPDGVHQSEAIQAIVRAEILDAIRDVRPAA